MNWIYCMNLIGDLLTVRHDDPLAKKLAVLLHGEMSLIGPGPPRWASASVSVIESLATAHIDDQCGRK